MAMNYTSRIMNNAVRALSVQQASIATTGNNIANVHTPGYSRRTVHLETGSSGSGGLSVGSGVQIGNILRQVDEYLNRSVRNTSGDASSYNVQNDLLSRVQSLFSLTDDSNTIGATMTRFFEAVNNLTTNPSSIELRADFIERAQDVVQSISSTFGALADLQGEIDLRISSEIDSVNSLTAQIAELNGQIRQVEANGDVAGDQRDQRDQLLESLAEKISFSVVETSDGTINVSLANGFPLVSGSTSRELEVTTTPSFSSGSLPPSLGGGVLGYIVYDYGQPGSEAHLDLTQIVKSGSGSLGGLLAMRGYNAASNTSAFEGDGVLVEVASRVEAITRQLLTTVNLAYLGPDRDGGTAGLQPSSGDLDGNAPSVFGLFDFTFGGVKDVDGDGRPELSDITDASVGIDSLSSVLRLTISDPRDVAAALDSGSGPPAAAVFAPGDGRNMEALAGLQDDEYSFAVGSYALTTTFGGAYNEMVNYVGNSKARAEVNATVSAGSLTAITNQRDSVSAVNLDEEFTNLIRSQKAFEASARMVKAAGDMLDTIVSLI